MYLLVIQSYYFAGETQKRDASVYEVSDPHMKQECQLHLILMFRERKVSFRWVWRRYCKDRRWIELAHGRVKKKLGIVWVVLNLSVPPPHK